MPSPLETVGGAFFYLLFLGQAESDRL